MRDVEPLDISEYPEDRDEFAVASSAVFATETMAGLLESQGDHDTAEEIRSELRDLSDLADVSEPEPVDTLDAASEVAWDSAVESESAAASGPDVASMSAGGACQPPEGVIAVHSWRCWRVPG